MKQPGGRTRLQREHARRERLRRENVAALEAESERKGMQPSAVERSVMDAIGTPVPRAAPTFGGPPPF